MDEDANKATLDAYEKGLKEYNAAAIMAVSGSIKDWIDASLAMLKLDSHILEIGSAHGRDALYIESKGFKVDRTDAAKSFIEYLQDQGHAARLLNVLTDKLGGPYDMVFANAVLLHFTAKQTQFVVKKINDALKPNGVFAFSVKIGEGSAWSHAKLKDARFYTYWQEKPLKEMLASSNFEIEYWEEARTGHDNADWFHVIARKSDFLVVG